MLCIKAMTMITKKGVTRAMYGQLVEYGTEESKVVHLEQATSLCCRRRWAGVVDAGFASTTDWKKDFLRTTDSRCKGGGLVGAPVDVRVADNASARAERSEAVVRHEKEEEQAKSRHHGLVGKGYYAEPGRRKAIVERREPGLQVGNVHRRVTQRRRKGRDSGVSSEQQIEGPK